MTKNRATRIARRLLKPAELKIKLRDCKEIGIHIYIHSKTMYLHFSLGAPSNHARSLIIEGNIQVRLAKRMFHLV